MHEKPIKQIRLDKSYWEECSFRFDAIDNNFNGTFKSLVINSRWIKVQLAWANLRMHCKYFSFEQIDLKTHYAYET